MKGTRRGKGPPSADLLVCFPSRAHLTLMPKPICSPARPSDSTKRHHNHDLKKISTRIGGVQAQSSPLLWSKSKNSEIISEPTSPKVTCAGQIKVKPKQGKSCKNWQSVMEEIEKLHNRKSQKKKGANWMEAIGIKKDVMQFLTCLRNIRFEFRCFGSFPTTAHDITSEEDEDEELDREANHIHRDINNNDEDEDEDEEEEASRTVFSKWFMVLQDENPKTELTKERDNDNDDDDNVPNCVPPPNALLLMRCRSAPPKSWLQETQQQVEEESEEEEKEVESTMEEMENKKKNENLVVMRYGSDFHRFSSDIAKESTTPPPRPTPPLPSATASFVNIKSLGEEFMLELKKAVMEKAAKGVTLLVFALVMGWVLLTFPFFKEGKTENLIIQEKELEALNTIAGVMELLVEIAACDDPEAKKLLADYKLKKKFW